MNAHGVTITRICHCDNLARCHTEFTWLFYWTLWFLHVIVNGDQVWNQLLASQMKSPVYRLTNRLFRAQRWHVQFLVIWTFWCQVTNISQAFLVHKNFQLFSAVLVENGQTHFGDMSSFVQDLTKSDCTKVTWWTWHLCAPKVSGFVKHKGDMSHIRHIMHLCSEMLYALLTRL